MAAVSPRNSIHGRKGRAPRKVVFHAGALLAMLALFGTGLYLWFNAHAQATIGGPFRLTDGAGHVVTNRDFRGKYLLIYFGYTYCPDICPTTLSDVASALDALGPDADKVQPIFITVDPWRDTPTVMRQQIAAISPRLIGLTGSPNEIAKVEKEFHVYAQKHVFGPGSNDYGMDHSSFLYLIGPDGRFVAPISPPTGVRALAQRLAALIR